MFLFKVILFSGAKKFTLSDHKNRAAASPTQPGRGGAKKIQVEPNVYYSFSPNLMIIC